MTGAVRTFGPTDVTARAALARGIALLEATVADDPPTLQWWHVPQDALVLARGARVAADEAACRAAGVEVVRRSSGGGPVLWGPDLLALDVIVPKNDPRWSGDVVGAYRWLGEALAEALTVLGAQARALPPDEARDRADGVGDRACFASFSPWEVVAVDGRKLVGLSQVRRTQGLLLQAGVLLHLDADTLPSLLAVDATSRAELSAALAARAAGLDTLIASPDAQAVVAAFHAAIT